MTEELNAVRSRRAMLKNGFALAGALAVPGAVAAASRAVAEPPVPAMPAMPIAKVAAAPITSPKVVRPELLRAALAAIERHGAALQRRDRIAIADFAAASGKPRFHFVDLASGTSSSLLVAHGSGSDPAHTGWLQRFSNAPGSNASSEGAFVTADYYTGKHGRSQRLIGLDPTNNNALARALVVHSAWYANKSMLQTHGMLGRSQGCFAVGESDLDEVFARLGVGRMIFAAKV